MESTLSFVDEAPGVGPHTEQRHYISPQNDVEPPDGECTDTQT